MRWTSDSFSLIINKKLGSTNSNLAEMIIYLKDDLIYCAGIRKQSR